MNQEKLGVTDKAEKNLLEMQELLTKRNEKSLKNEKMLFSCSILSYCVMCLTAFALLQLIISICTCYKIEKEVDARHMSGIIFVIDRNFIAAFWF